MTLSPKRKGRVTASSAGAILGCDPHRTRDDVMRAMVREYHNAEPEFTGNPATEWGNGNEARAIRQYEDEISIGWSDKITVKESKFYIYDDWLGATPDGENSLNNLVEIKCPYGLRNEQQPKFKSILNGELPHYYAQCQIQMLCSGKELVDFYQWTPFGTSIEIVSFDHDWMRENYRKLQKFYADYLGEREYDFEKHLKPRHEKNDSIKIEQLAAEYFEITDEIKALDSKKKDLLDEIIELSGGKELEIDGHKLTKVIRKGAIDYKKVPELSGVDLEEYRKKSSEYWSLR